MSATSGSRRRYGRVVLTLSGESLAGFSGWGVDPDELGRLADEVLAVQGFDVASDAVAEPGDVLRLSV